MSTSVHATNPSLGTSAGQLVQQPKVLLFEDDIGQREHFKSVLETGRLIDVVAAGSVADAVEMWQAHCFAAAVLDLRSDESEVDRKATNATECPSGIPGERLARWIRQRAASLPIFGMTLENGDVKATESPANEWFASSANVTRRPFGIYDKLTQFVTLRYHLFRALDLDFKVKVFLVHGSDTKWLDAFGRLADQFGFESVILRDQIRHNRDWFSMIEDEVNRSTIAWIIHTGDDWGMPRNSDLDPEPELRSRPNVLFEQGYLFGRFGRGSGRVFVFKCGNVSLPTDIENLACTSVIRGLPISRKNVLEIRRQMEHWDPSDPDENRS
jgi:CheY-like chemotaxis protein